MTRKETRRALQDAIDSLNDLALATSKLKGHDDPAVAAMAKLTNDLVNPIWLCLMDQRDRFNEPATTQAEVQS